jgi:DNA polymerase-3 subunit delta
MKVPPRSLDAFVKNPSAETLAVLVYGPDTGLVHERLNTLTKNVVADPNDPFNVADISLTQLLERPSLLLDEAQAISMLGGRRVVRLKDATDKVSGMVKDALAQLKSGDGLLLIGAGELSPRSSLRLLFEQSENAAAIPCYVDDARDISRVIADDLKVRGYSISSEALSYMAANVTGDRGIARAEAEKLTLYMGGYKNIALEDVTACIGAAADMPLDDLIKHVAGSDFAAADKTLTHILAEGENAVRVLRSLQNHFMRLHLVKSRMQNGDSMDAAMAKLRPPVFWKMKTLFQTQVQHWPQAQMEQALSLLNTAEMRCKQTGQEPALALSRALLSLCQMAGRAARRRA